MSNHSPSDLELTLTAVGAVYELRMRLKRPGEGADYHSAAFPVAIDRAALLAVSGNPAVYGAALRAMVFSEAAAVQFKTMCAAAIGNGDTLRIHLHLPPDLNTLRWETLLVPGTERAMAVDGHLLLSRYISSQDYAPITLRPKGKLRALIAVAAPDDYVAYKLAPINAAAETTPIQAALGELHPTTITATWKALSDALRDGYDIVYLVAHGTLQAGQPWLYLVNDHGTIDRRSGKDLAPLLDSLGTRRPRLVVLASCAGAGDGYADTLAALGPQIAQAGVPAVLAMQGDVSLPTGQAFMPVFFRELLHDGFIDRAVNSARLEVSARPDWWMPVLYTRLTDGRIWVEPEIHQQQANSASALISFGQDNQFSDVNLRDVVGRDQYNFYIAKATFVEPIKNQTVATPLSPTMPLPKHTPTPPPPNPFGRRGRIDDPAEFFGRTELLRRIFEELSKGSNLALIGERQVGKSSLLCMIERQGAAKLDLPAGAVVSLDMQLIHSEEEFFAALCDELNLPFSRGYKLARQLRGRRSILCLDEIEKMKRGTFSANVRDELRGLADGAKAPLSLVVASSVPLADLFPDKLGEVSPLANICSPLDVSPFTRTEAQAFLATRLEGTGITFDADEIAELLEQSRRHPGELQRLAAELYRRKAGA